MAKPKNMAKTTRNTTHRRKRMSEALDYHLQGFTYRQIAAEMRISVATAHKYVKEAVQEVIPRDKAETVLGLQLERYNMLLAAFMTPALQGDSFAADRCFTAMANISRLNGVDSPIMKDAAQEVAGQLTELLEAAKNQIS